jgi:hypothetical protein
MRQSRAARLAWLVLLLWLPALAVPAGAEASWSAPIAIADMQWRGSQQSVAVDPNGNAVFVWAERQYCNLVTCNLIKSRARSAAGVLGPVETISEPNTITDWPRVAVDSNGNAILVWRGPQGTVQARARSAAGVLGPIETLANGSYPEVAIDGNGNAVVVWWGRGGYIQTRTRTPAGALSATQTLAGPNAPGWGYPQLAVDPNGNSVFVWTLADDSTDCGGEPCYLVQTRARASTGRLSPIQTLSPGGEQSEPSTLNVGIDSSGNAVFVWEFIERESGLLRIQARARSATGSLSANQVLSPAGRVAVDPDVAVDPNGNAVAVWGRYGGGTGCNGSPCRFIEAISRSAAGALSSTQLLSGFGHTASTPKVGIDATGNAVVVWESYDWSTGCGGGGCTLIQTRVRSAAGTLSATKTLSAFADVLPAFPQVAVTPSGKATAFWRRGIGSGDRVNLLAATGP